MNSSTMSIYVYKFGCSYFFWVCLLVSIWYIHRSGTLGDTVCCVQLLEIMPAVYKSSDCSTSLITLTIVCANTTRGLLLLVQFSDEENEAQRDQDKCPRSNSQQVVELEFEESLTPEPLFLNYMNLLS